MNKIVELNNCELAVVSGGNNVTSGNSTSINSSCMPCNCAPCNENNDSGSLAWYIIKKIIVVCFFTSLAAHTAVVLSDV